MPYNLTDNEFMVVEALADMLDVTIDDVRLHDLAERLMVAIDNEIDGKIEQHKIDDKH